jgi:hypothetical protein
MAARRRKSYRKLLTLEAGARAARYAYFVRRDDGHVGWMWELYDGVNLLCSSPPFRSKAECLKTLRATRRHASTTVVRDDER